MSYRSLLVVLDQTPATDECTRVAIRLAKSFDAHLTGLAPTGVIELPGHLAGAASLAEFSAMAWDSLREQAHGAARAFDAACAAARFSAAESVVDEADFATALLGQAQCHDLAVLSQPDPRSPAHALRQAIVEQVILYGARPALLLPYAGNFDVPSQKVMIAWDGSREAARAVADALPLLHKARQVHVVSWRERSLLGADPATVRLEGLRRWLLWHGVNAETHVEVASAPIAEAMLSRISDLDADLLVMGAYGHSRWTERMLGGATRGLLASMTVPVLMSH
jgi:nucleotide-binding universal stress UspA family protein